MKMHIARIAALIAAVALATSAAVPQRGALSRTTAAAPIAASATRPARSTTTCWRSPGARPTAPDRRGNGYEPQCDARSGRPYAFVLHGLWPQHERGWPQDCRTSDRGWVPGPVADRMLDIMPSKRLVFNEYRKHGTCSGLGVDGYFDLARQLYDKVKIPPRFVRVADDRLLVSPGELIGEFLAANPQAQAGHDRGAVRRIGQPPARRCASASTRAAISAPAATTRTSAGCARPIACTCRRFARAPQGRSRIGRPVRSGKSSPCRNRRRHRLGRTQHDLTNSSSPRP